MRICSRRFWYLLAMAGIPISSAVAWWFYYPHWLWSRAESAAAANDLGRAEPLLQQVMRQEPQKFRAHLLYAQVLRRNHRPGQAQAALYQAMRLGLSPAVGRREFALAEADRHFTSAVDKNLRLLLAEDGNDREVLQALANGCASVQRWQDADDCFSALLRLDPSDAEVQLARGKMRLDAVGFQHGKAADAADDFRAVLRRRPDHFEARLYLSHCFLSDAQMPQARQQLLVCSTMRPERIEPWIGLAACAVEERDWQEADDLLKRAQSIDPRSTYVLGMRGDLCLRQQQFDQAIPYFQELLALDRANKAAYLKLAQCFRFKGELPKAQELEAAYQKLMDQTDAGR